MIFKAEKLRQLREGKGLSLTQAADQLKWTVSYLGDLEKGRKKNPWEATIKRLCDFYKVPKEYFYLEKKALLADLPDMPADIKDFVLCGDNIEYLRVVMTAKASGVSAGDLAQFVKIISNRKPF
ncbi:MAG: helix-turn-helix transcriptional regulator [Negativicutes bacterium]|nr:helix-turn-helix transcriptional regulator [Negativicutes bacterium]